MSHSLHAARRCGLAVVSAVARSAVSPSLLVTRMSCAKTAEPIEMPFGREIRLGAHSDSSGPKESFRAVSYTHLTLPTIYSV